MKCFYKYEMFLQRLGYLRLFVLRDERIVEWDDVEKTLQQRDFLSKPN